MKACVLSDWEQLEFKDLPMPVPEKGEVLVEVLYGGVCGSDITVMHHRHLTATIPRIMCHEILGIVREINTDEPVDYKVGDRCVVFPLRYCGKCDPCTDGNFHVCKNLEIMGVHIDGGFTQYCVANADSIVPVPDDLPDEIAVLTEPFSVGFHANMRAQTKPGDKVLVTGAGPIGMLAAITAKYFGAGLVLVSEVNDNRRSLAEEFGFPTIDPSKEDVVAKGLDLTKGVGFDILLEASGAQGAYDIAVPVLKERGVLVAIGIPSVPRSFQTNSFVLKELSFLGMRVCPRKEFSRAAEMLVTMYRNKTYPLEKCIDRVFPFEECEEALKLHESGENRCKVIIKIKED